MKYVLYGVLILFAGLIVWGLVEPYVIDVQAYTVDIPNLPAAWEGKELAVIADFQVGMWLDNVSTIRRTVDRLVEREPDLVLILGDFIYHGGETALARIQEAAALTAPLPEAGILTVAVLGNHDYSLESRDLSKKDTERAQRMRDALEDVGVQMLHNASIPVALPDAPDDPLYVAGIGSWMASESRPQQALAEVPRDAARVVIMHNPDSFEEVPAHAAPLGLAGHTHGGQIRIPGFPQWSWMTLIQGGRVTADGWIANYGAEGNQLYVNRGIGFSILPIRFACPPEITLLTLHRAAQ